MSWTLGCQPCFYTAALGLLRPWDGRSLLVADKALLRLDPANLRCLSAPPPAQRCLLPDAHPTPTGLGHSQGWCLRGSDRGRPVPSGCSGPSSDGALASQGLRCQGPRGPGWDVGSQSGPSWGTRLPPEGEKWAPPSKSPEKAQSRRRTGREPGAADSWGPWVLRCPCPCSALVWEAVPSFFPSPGRGLTLSLR